MPSHYVFVLKTDQQSIYQIILIVLIHNSNKKKIPLLILEIMKDRVG